METLNTRLLYPLLIDVSVVFEVFTVIVHCYCAGARSSTVFVGGGDVDALHPLYTVVNTSSFCVSVFLCTHKCLFFSTSSARKRYVFAFSAQRISFYLAKFCWAQSAKMEI